MQRRRARRSDLRRAAGDGEGLAASHRATVGRALDADIDTLKQRLRTAGYLQPVGNHQEASMSSPSRSEVGVATSVLKPAPLSLAFFSPEASLPKNLPLTRGEHPRQRNRPGSGHAWSSIGGGDASPPSAAELPQLRPAVLQECHIGTADACSSSPESINVPLHEFVHADAQSRCSASKASAVERTPLVQRVVLYTLDLALLCVALWIVAFASAAGWRRALPAKMATTTTMTTAVERHVLVDATL